MLNTSTISASSTGALSKYGSRSSSELDDTRSTRSTRSDENFEAPSQPVVQDNRCKAVLFMNLFAVGATGNSVFFKMAAAQGAQVADYQVFRNVSILLVAGIQLYFSRHNPFKEFPWDSKNTLFWRCFFGQMTFFLFNFCLNLVPLTIQTVLFQTGTFWISILACACFNEPIIPLELIAMLICFAAMVAITVFSTSSIDESEAGITAEDSQHTSEQLMLGYALVFVCAWFYAINCVLARVLKSVHPGVMMFWHGVLGLILAFFGIAITAWVNGEGLSILNYDREVYILMICATLFDTLQVNSQTIAFQSGSSGFVSLISYVNVLYAFIFDSLIFDETFTWVQLVASAVIMIVTVSTSIIKLAEGEKNETLAKQEQLTQPLRDDNFMVSEKGGRHLVV